ncbi:hypothetical protein FS842_009140 [Serendipita sp. 407]|nr:hypothetical protein FS842_009140 [Serendipita sp. 407]
MGRTVAPPASTETGSAPPEDRRLEVIYSSVVLLIVAFAFWTFPIIRVVINPLKLFVIGWHEFCHIAAAILTGGTILSISIDPNLGGACEMEGGVASIILSAGYLGSLGLGDLIDERFKKKQNSSDITQYSLMFPSIPRPVWTVFWSLLTTAALLGFSALGYVKFDLNSDEMYAQAHTFLPT